MTVEWQGDHSLLDKSGEKQDFEHELTRLGLDPSKFLVEVRREPHLPGPDGLYAIPTTSISATWSTRIGRPGNYTKDMARTGSRSSQEFAVGSLFRGALANVANPRS